MKLASLLRIFGAALLLPVLAAGATLTFEDIFTTDDELAWALFQVLPGQPVTITTTSYASGGFDPILTIFDSTGLVVNANDDGGCGVVAAASNGRCLDSYLALSITGGTYSFYVTQSPNTALGDLADGFALAGTGNFTGGPFYDSFGDLRTGHWRVEIDGALAAVPEPSTFILIAAGLLLAGLWRLRGSRCPTSMMKTLTAILLAACALPAFAVDAPASADTYLNSAQPANNFGALPNLSVGGTNRTLINYDLGGLPAGVTAADVVKATLVFRVNKIGTPGAVDVVGVTSSWDELTATSGTQPGSGVVAATVTVDAANLDYRADITSLVQGWLNGSPGRFGVWIQPAGSSPSTVVALDSKENTLTSRASHIEIVLAGPAGPQGPKGDAGATGAQGPKGDTGAAGAQGPKGDTGATGAQGPKGDTGATGAQGPKGDTGANGAPGAQGPKGDTGSAGAQGPKGDPGSAGAGAGLILGRIDTLASASAGTTYYAGVSGSNSATANESLITIPMPVACTARNLRVRVDSNGSENRTLTLRVNGSATSLKCSYSTSGFQVTSCSDTSNSAAISAGDTIAYGLTGTGAANTYITIGIQCN